MTSKFQAACGCCGLSALILFVAPIISHPGVGIVQDSLGNVFFTDLKQIWKIATDGKMSIAVANVHSHELCIDPDDNLYGEHLSYVDGRWRHRVWCLKADGTLSDVIRERDGFLDDYSFVRDRNQNMYWADRGETTVIKKRTPDGTISTHATGDFRQLQWMSAAPDGTLFVMDGGDLRRIAPDGQVSTAAVKLSEQDPPNAHVSDLNYHMGIWLDGDNQPNVAVAEEKVVLVVKPNGERRVIARTDDSWWPSGGMYDKDGNLWLLEYNRKNQVRARRIDQNGGETMFDPNRNR